MSTMPRRKLSIRKSALSIQPTIHSLQVRAFLRASEVVDVDEETIEDILDGLDGGSEMDKSKENFADEGELDLSALYSDQSQADWTEEQIEVIMYVVKQHGMSTFMPVVLSNPIVHSIPSLLRAFGVHLCKELQKKKQNTLLYFLRVVISHQLGIRHRLTSYKSLSDAVQLISRSKHIMILTGAGISVSCGIPDFRSRDGLYASLKEKAEYDLDDPQQMFDIHYFRENPSVFYSFASQIYPSNFTPSPCHRFIKLVEDKGKLLRNYTQNIDNLEQAAGCGNRLPGSALEGEIRQKRVPLCTVCNPTGLLTSKKRGKQWGRKKKWDSEEEDESDGPDYPPGIMKPDITFFGEKLTDKFDQSILEDRLKVDLLLIIGTSLKVTPFSGILSSLPHSVPQILINKTPIRHINPDIVLLGDADKIVQHLCQMLNWELPPPPLSTSTHVQHPRGNVKKRKSDAVQEPRQVGDSHVWLFEGAEGGKWARDIEETYKQSTKDTQCEPKKARTK